jgi:hypothetical protein
MTGKVYLLLMVDIEGKEFFKIGITSGSINKRIKSLQTGNPNKIQYLNHYESKEYRLIERMFHAKYNMNKTLAENEWFNLSNDEVLNFIIDCQKFEETIKFLKKENQFFK